MKVSLASFSFCSILLLAFSTAVLAQGTEVEPNHPCDLAQSLGEVALPFSLQGALDALLPEGDVDFYRFRGTPNAGIRVDHQGFDSGNGTLRDPFLGLFDSNCQFLKLGDDRGSRDAQLLATIPADGEFILAATACCDYEFDGEVGAGGSYLLSIQGATFLRSIRGRVVDALSGTPLEDSRVELYRCVLSDCLDFENSIYTADDGEFLFEMDAWGDPLFAGTYRIRIEHDEHAVMESILQDIGEGEERNLGDIALAPLARIGSITGRLVDSVSGIPLPGGMFPFARVELWYCAGDSCNGIRFLAADEQGRFQFDNEPSGVLPPGTYEVHAEAEEYRAYATASFTVAEGEDAVLNDLPLEPFPVGFSEIRPCGDMPPQGGICLFSVRITNRSSEPLNGSAWPIVNAYGTGSLANQTTFQAGNRWVSLAGGHSQVVRFLFVIPPAIRDGSFICSDLFFGQGPPGIAFNTVGHRSLFCISKGANGAFRVLSKKEHGQLLLERRRERVETRPRR